MANVIFSFLEDTAANIAAAKRALLMAFDSTNKRIKYFDASTTEYEALTLDATGTPTRAIGDITTGALTSVGNVDVGTDSDNKLIITAALTYLKANGYKILDYLYSNGFMSINPDGADIDFEISGTGYATAPIIHCNAGTNKVGIGTATPSTLVQIVKSSNSDYASIYPTLSLDNSLATQGDGSTTYNKARLALSSGNYTVAADFLVTYESTGVQGSGAHLRTTTAHPLNLWTNNSIRLTIDSSGNIVINDSGASIDMRVEGDTDANLLVTDGSADKVGIGIAAPTEKLDVIGNIKASGNLSAMRKVVAVGATNEYQFDGDVPASLVRYMEITLPTNSNARAAEAGKAVFTVKYYDDPDLHAACRIDVAWMKITGIDQYVITNVKTGGGTVTPPDISEAFSIVSGKLRLTVTASLGAGEEGTAIVNGQIVEFVDWEVFSY